MAPQPPLSRLTLSASSAAEDLSFVALDDISRIRVNGEQLDFRLIGGQMVSLHVQRWQLGRELYRETQDADIGVLPIAVRTTDFLDQIRHLGYNHVEGNRFTKPVADLPVGVPSGNPEAVLDVLVPAYTSKARDNVRVGEELVTTEVMGLAQAFHRDPITVEIEFVRMNRAVLNMKILLPDEVSGLFLKAFAWQVRSEGRDAVDIWRMLEVAAVAGITPQSFASHQAARAAEIIRDAFSSSKGMALKKLAHSSGISKDEARRRHTRIRALIQRVLG